MSHLICFIRLGSIALWGTLAVPGQTQQTTPIPIVVAPAQEPGANNRNRNPETESVPLQSQNPHPDGLRTKRDINDSPVQFHEDVRSNGTITDIPLSMELSSQRMVDRTRRILVLRRLLSLGFSRKDIELALSMLRRLHDIKTSPPADPEKAMDAEYRALLAAGPNDPLPPSSVLNIIDAARYSREEQAKIWTEMSRRLGKTKAEGLFNLLGQGDSSLPFSMGSNGEGGNYTGFSANGADKPRVTGPYGVVTSPPVNGAEKNATENRGQSALPSREVAPAPKAGDQPAGALPDPKTGQANSHPTPGQTPRVPSVPVDSQIGKGGESKPPETTRVRFSASTIRISLTEMIDLLQEKLKAMPIPSTAS